MSDAAAAPFRHLLRVVMTGGLTDSASTSAAFAGAVAYPIVLMRVPLKKNTLKKSGQLTKTKQGAV
jgi:hypothetical protein